MEVKMFEIRDHMTCISAMAIRPVPKNPSERWLLGRVGFGAGHDAVILHHIASDKVHSGPYEWNDRTLQTSHLHIRDNWATLVTGDVIDVRFILGETESPVVSDMLFPMGSKDAPR